MRGRELGQVLAESRCPSDWRARGGSSVASACLLEMSGHRCLSRAAIERPYSDIGVADAPASTAATTVTDPEGGPTNGAPLPRDLRDALGRHDDLHTAYEQGLQTARSWFGSTLPVYVDGESRTTGETSEVRSPVDTSIVLCRVHSATPADVADAVAAARRAAGSWAATPWQGALRCCAAQPP